MNLWLQIVASNVLVASLIALLAWQLGRSGRRAAIAHVLWVAFFVKLITPPIVLLPVSVPAHWLPSAATTYTGSFTFLRPAALPVAARTSEVALQTAKGMPRTSDLPIGLTTARPSIGLGNAIAAIWLLGFLFVLLRGLIRFFRFHRLLLREGKLDQQASATVQALLRTKSSPAGRRSVPRVLRLPVRVSPMLFGFGRRPVIVCPDQLWDSLSSEDRQAFLAHETAHYCRRDHWVRWLEWIVIAVYWWFPGVYLARRQLERHEEACCDAWAVRRLDSSPRQYAEALLRVVDFISEHRVGIPKFASGMQPTDSLEERLRLVMQRRPNDNVSGVAHWSVGVACVSVWLLHPIPLPSSTPLIAEVDDGAFQQQPIVESAGGPDRLPLPGDIELPEVPVGYWNKTPRRQWASFSLALPGARLVAEANRGISIETPGREPLLFSSDELTALVEIPSTQRIVIGDRLGNLRLWDLTAGMAVSLIGRHAGAVTSVTYHENSGLVSADDRGSVMRWDLQSGQVVATWSAPTGTAAPTSVQSVRCSTDGSQLAILTGGWNDSDRPQQIQIVDSRTLESLDSSPSSMLARPLAIVIPAEQFGWVTVDWSGAVSTLDAGQPLGILSKNQVSALVLSQATRLQFSSVESGS